MFNFTSPVVQEVKSGRYTVGIDENGGLHIDGPEDHTKDVWAAFSPDFVDDIIEAREDVIEDE